MSSIRSILVQLDAAPPSIARLEVARALALRHGAELSAMFVARDPEPAIEVAFSEGPAAMFEMPQHGDLRHSKAEFVESLAEDHAATRWLDGGDDAAASFLRQSLCADLLVLAQHAPRDETAETPPPGFLESVLLGTGKPALILPSAWKSRPLGNDVLVGWNATAQAAHAVTAALPWLRAARRVHVLESVAEPATAQCDAPSLERYLRCHDIVASMHRRLAPSADAGQLLNALAEEVDADLLVMGCFGHARAREWILGGASRTILQSMSRPVLMAH